MLRFNRGDDVFVLDGNALYYPAGDEFIPLKEFAMIMDSHVRPVRFAVSGKGMNRNMSAEFIAKVVESYLFNPFEPNLENYIRKYHSKPKSTGKRL